MENPDTVGARRPVSLSRLSYDLLLKPQWLMVLWSLYLVGLVILDFRKVWAFQELPQHLIASALRLGTSWRWADFTHAFDFQELDGASRARFLSALFLIGNEKFRIAWTRAFPPHPSLSLTWIFSLGLTPWVYFRAARRILGTTRAAWTGLLLFLSSAGFLSGIAMLLHPAKPMAVFMMSLTLYLGALVDRSWHDERKFPGLLFALMSTVVFCGFFFDETAWFAVVAVPLYFPDIFSFTRQRLGSNAAWLALFPLYLLVTTLVVPHFLPDFHFWSYAVSSNGAFLRLHLRPFLANAVYLPAAQLSWSRHGPITLAWVALHTAVLWCVSRAAGRRGDGPSGWRLLVVPLLFILFDSLILTRQTGVVDSTYYYAALFPLFFSLWLASLLSATPPRVASWLLLYVMLLSIHHFESTNQRWRIGNSGATVRPDRARVWELWETHRHRPLSDAERAELAAMVPGIAVEIRLDASPPR